MRASLTFPHRPGVEDSIMSRVGNLGDQIWLHQKYKRQNFITIPRLIEKAKISCKILSKGFLLSA